MAEQAWITTGIRHAHHEQSLDPFLFLNNKRLSRFAMSQIPARLLPPAPPPPTTAHCFAHPLPPRHRLLNAPVPLRSLPRCLCVRLPLALPPLPDRLYRAGHG